MEIIIIFLRPLNWSSPKYRKHKIILHPDEVGAEGEQREAPHLGMFG